MGNGQWPPAGISDTHSEWPAVPAKPRAKQETGCFGGSPVTLPLSLARSGVSGRQQFHGRLSVLFCSTSSSSSSSSSSLSHLHLVDIPSFAVSVFVGQVLAVVPCRLCSRCIASPQKSVTEFVFTPRLNTTPQATRCDYCSAIVPFLTPFNSISGAAGPCFNFLLPFFASTILYFASIYRTEPSLHKRLSRFVPSSPRARNFQTTFYLDPRLDFSSKGSLRAILNRNS